MTSSLKPYRLLDNQLNRYSIGLLKKLIFRKLVKFVLQKDYSLLYVEELRRLSFT